MALPTNLSAKLKAVPMDPVALASDLQLAYTLSFSQHNVTHESIYLYPRDLTQSPLEQYQFADFDSSTYQQLLDQAVKNYKMKNKQLVKGMRCGFKQFYARVAASTFSTAVKFLSKQKNAGQRKLTLAKQEEQQYRIQKLKANNPTKWPESTKQFVKDLNNLPWHAFSTDSEYMFVEFVQSAKNAIISLCYKAKMIEGKLEATFKQNLLIEVQAFLGVILRTNNQTFILQHLQFISDLHRYLQVDPQSQLQICKRITSIFDGFFKLIPRQSTKKYHYPASLWNKDPFVIMKKLHFQKYAGLCYYSIATDGNFLYIYISALNGGMFKIGTGNGKTKAGKVYLEKQVHFPIGTKVDEVNWVYLKGKLYLKTSSKDPWVLQVIDPETFKKEGNTQLFCPSLFGQQSLINLNKNSPLLTDGNNLYFLGVRLKICKNQQNQELNQNKQSKSPEKQGEDKKQPEQKRKNIKKKPGKKNQLNQNPPQDQKSQNYQKILEIVLYQFSVDGKKTYVYDGIDQKETDQLYDSFSGYFSKEECIRALVLNNYDLAETCQWLFNQGEKQKDKNIKIMDQIDHVIIAECQITSNFNQKAIKGPSEITTKDGSILNIFNIFQSIWSMDKQQVTCYSQTGAKVFSRSRKDFKKHPETKLSNTLIKIFQTKFPRNPEFNIIYDPYNFIFYTYTWPQDGHYFPTTVLISNDKKYSPKSKNSFDNLGYKLLNLKNVRKIVLWYMLSVDKSSIKTKYRFNDWLWYYGQRVIEVGNQLNQTDSDKKRLSNKRTKLLVKINKINEVQKIYQKNKVQFANTNKVVRKIVKIRPFQSQGTLKNYLLINEVFKNIQISSEQVPLYIACLQNWLQSNSSFFNAQIKNVLIELGANLQKLRSSSNISNNLINKLLLKQFYTFFPTIERQIQVITSLNQSQLLDFIRYQVQDQKKQKEEITYELAKKQQLIQKYQTNKCDFADIFKSQSNVSLNENKNIQNFANLLFNDVIQVHKETLVTKEKINQNSKKAFAQYLQKQLLESEVGSKFIQNIFLSALKMLTSNPKNSANFHKYFTELFIEVFGIYERVIPKIKTLQVFNLLPTFIFIVEIYHGSPVSLHPNQAIVNSLLHIAQSLQRPQLNEIHNLLQDYEFEGISPITEKIYETSHPVQRGKNYNFAPKNFHNASYLLLDLDRRCQSDSNNDTLSVQMIHQDSPVGNNIQVNDGVFNSNLRLSGAVETKKPYMIFGNAVTVDFNSSGHVKDTQSLVRYGFKFGLRPIYTGKLKLNDQKKEKLIRLFKNMQNFQNYFNTLKFITLALSNTIQNYLVTENEVTEQRINNLLKGKIFKQGFEQTAYKFDYSNFNSLDTVHSFISNSEGQTVDRLILKKNQQKYFVYDQFKVEKKLPKEEILWNFQGIPVYIKNYLQQIKDFKGDFIDVFTEARELAKEKGNYAVMMRKKAVQQHKTLWLQGEAILFLTILKHSGLLHLNLKFSIQYIKQNLKAFEDARDGIYNSFISRIQYANEWRNLIDTYLGKQQQQEEKKQEKKQEAVKEQAKPAAIKTIAVKRKGPAKTVQIGTKIAEKKQQQKPALKKQKVEQKPKRQAMQKVAFEKAVRERLSNESLIKGICNFKNIKYDENFQYDTVTQIIEELIKASQRPLETEQKAYKDPIEHLIKGCLFLLKFNSPSTKQSLTGHEQIVPVNMSRSLSSDNRNNVDANKLKLFRQWLQNWKSWKGFKKEGRVELQFPVQEIVKYINSWIDLEEIYKSINKRYLKCENRIQFYTYTQQLQKLLSQTKFVKYALGSEVLNIQNDYLSGLESISQNKLKELQQRYNEFKLNIKVIEGSFFQKLPLALESLQNSLKGGSSKFLEKIKLLEQSIFLLQSENPEINLNLLLYFISFKYLSTQNQDMVYLSNSLIQKGFISYHSNQNIVQVLMRQIGNNNINFKRWKDYFFVERVFFLLRKIQLNLRSKKAVPSSTQQRIGESIFYLLYHIQIPLIARIGLKILRRLNISLKDGIKTPFDYQYKLYKQNQRNELELKQQFRLPRNNRNNITLLCSKINNIFDQKYSNELASRFQEAKQKAQSQLKYNVILNLHQEEDLYWLIKVLYYIDELEKKSGEKVIPEIKDFDQYLQMKNRKREGDKKQQQNPNEGQKQKNIFKEHQKQERIFNNLPKFGKISPELQKELPVGWFFNYCNIFADPLQKSNSQAISKSMKNIPNPANFQNALKNPKNKNQNNNNNQNPNQRKNWNTPIFSKLSKKYEEFNSKPPQQPKQGDSAQLKAQFVKAKNYFLRIKKYFTQITIMMDQFSRSGYYLFREDIKKVKMNQICQLITTGSTNRLKDIDIDLKNNDVKVRLTVNDFAPNFNSKLKITIIKTSDFPYFDNMVTYQAALSNRPDHTQNLYFNLLGKRQLSLEDAKSFMPYEEFIALDQSAQDQDIEFGKQWIESNFSRMKKKHEKVYLNDYPNDTFYIGQGGIESGIKDNILIPANDSSLTLQTSNYQKILTQPKIKNAEEYEQTQLPEELIEKINKILQKGSIQITKKTDIRQYLLLNFYLKKLKKFDLQFVDRAISKQFAQKLFKFSENLKSYKELQAYQEDIQKLIVKLIDNEHQKLHLFGTYLHDDDYDVDVEEYLIPMKLQKLNSSNEVKQQSIQTHSYIKSKYLLKSQPPQMQQNKLLKYWQKNILPRILEFVKTTLKPIQIEDFWQQMRRPLRIGDHTEAKRVAYIICDNKLPAGAVLPDATHNWNSLQIQQIFVGENVIVKIPRSKSDFSTPLLGWGNNDQKLAKIVFVDLKNNSVLVRYRLEELAIFSYTWVPINCLMAVEKQVMHISTKSIYEQLNKKLEGVIYIYAKECLTKLASSVSDGDNIKLIKETILDLFIKNPISGCFNFPKPVWSMRPIFEKMLEEGNFAIIDSLQKHFCSIKGIDLNLNTQKMIQLNRFENAKALILSFKKDAKLAVCSGVRFYNDKFGYNEVAHVYTAKTQKTDIQPIEFNEPNIYCKYYTNKQCLPIVQQNNYKIYPIQVTVFAVDDMWTIGCYLGEVVCQIATAKNSLNYLTILQRFNTLFLKWLNKKSVSVLCSHLSRLISKITLTIVQICQKNNKEVTLQILGTNLDQLKDMIAWSSNVQSEQSNQKVALYSALLQNLSQLIASLIVKTNVNLPNIPEHIKSTSDLIKMFKQIDNFTKTKKMSLIIPNTQANYQWQRILEISNIPSYFNKETVYNKIKQIIQSNKGKILCPKLDIYQKNGVCYVLVDGWDINELIQEEIIEKMEQIEEERQEQINQGASLMQWECSACTYKNPPDVNICQICEFPAPVAAKQQQVYDVVQATDLKAAEKKLKERQAKRFEEVKVQILKFFEDQFKVVCDLVQKRNQEIEQQGKKEAKKNKKQNQLEELKQIPKKPEIKLETGSRVFQKESIEVFLKERFQYFPAQLKKLVEEEQTYIGRFKQLLNHGYDLWGDCVTNENATLIPFNHLYLLMDYIQTEICKGSSSVLSYSEDSIRILSAIPLLDHKFQVQPVNYTSENDIGVRVKYKTLVGFKSYNIRFSWKLVKELNLAASKCLQFVNMDLKFDKDRNDTCPIYNDSLGYKLKYFRNLIMGVIKLELFQKIIQKTSIPRQNDEIPKIFLERLKIKENKNRLGLVTVKQKQDFLFTKAHDQFLKVSHAFLRPFKPKGADPYLSFTVTFKGENVQGEAGPYRQFFTDIARELQPRNLLGLFIPSPNNRNQTGEFKSKWVINPKANSSYHFSLFEFIGTLMGCCFRTGGHLALDLPTMFWKSVTHEQITDADLDQVDSQLLSFIKMLKECPSEQAFEQAMQYTNGGKLTWVYRGYDDQIHEMIYNGKNIPVQFEDIGKYIEMLKLKKINETKLQIKRIVQGLSQLIPMPYLHCLTGEELKLSICGRPKVDVDLLKKHTKYSGGLNQQSRRIKFFWDIMRELPETQRLKIIRFCWGQQRLPINSEEFERNNIRFMIKPMMANNKNQDQALPRADTCFFNIDLPDYSTKAIMRQKILLAVNLDNVSINADEINNDDNPLMNEIDTYGQEEYQEGEEQW